MNPFDPTDYSIGPSMYTVTEQYIKPVTAAAGNVSWALMKHPSGLPCDVFITHAWAEGVFEFIDKVFSSWPQGGRAAYVCFLSNPQNLDIADLISTPEQSPFAKALDSCRHVIAVPNRVCSIYSRLWCVYEAFLAYTWNKPITNATSLEAQFACAFFCQAQRVQDHPEDCPGPPERQFILWPPRLSNKEVLGPYETTQRFSIYPRQPTCEAYLSAV